MNRKDNKKWIMYSQKKNKDNRKKWTMYSKKNQDNKKNILYPGVKKFNSNNNLNLNLRKQIHLDLKNPVKNIQNEYFAGSFDAIGRISLSQGISFSLGLDLDLAKKMKKHFYDIGTINKSPIKKVVNYTIKEANDCLLFYLLMYNRLYNLEKKKMLQLLVNKTQTLSKNDKALEPFVVSNRKLKKSAYITGAVDQRIYFVMNHYIKENRFYFAIKVIHNSFDKGNSDEIPKHFSYLIQHFGGKYEDYEYKYKTKTYQSCHYILTCNDEEIFPKSNSEMDHGFWKLIRYFNRNKFFNDNNKQQLEKFIEIYDVLKKGDHNNWELKKDWQAIIHEFGKLKELEKKKKKNYLTHNLIDLVQKKSLKIKNKI